MLGECVKKACPHQIIAFVLSAYSPKFAEISLDYSFTNQRYQIEMQFLIAVPNKPRSSDILPNSADEDKRT